MLLKICGAAREVTGSNYLLEIGGRRVLIDCGMHQGTNEQANYEPFPYAANSIDAVLLTHGHIDHSGRIPKLVKEGFKGKIYCTLPTVELVKILWDDSVKIMREDAQWRSNKNVRRGLPPVEPLYGQEEADAAKELFVPVSYDSRIEVVPGVSVRFRDAGHILGSSIIEMLLEEKGKIVRIVFSGDLGPLKTVMERSPAEITDADYVLIESTYGNREHKNNEETREEFQSLMKKIFAEKKAKVFIPTFVVDRAQRIMYELALLREKGVGGGTPVYFDSPMGVKATRLYHEHMDLMSDEIQAYRLKGGEPFSSEDVIEVSTRSQSQAINNKKYGIVLAGSGMCNGGRIVHHLKNGIWNPDNHIVFVGYQARGTLGRRIVDGAKRVRVCGESVDVKAEIHTIGGFSAHADRTDLLSWAERFRPTMPCFLVTHGEEPASESLAEALQTRGFEAFVPYVGQEITLEPRKAGEKIRAAIADSHAAPKPVRIDESEVPADPSGQAVSAVHGSENEKEVTSEKNTLLEKIPAVERNTSISSRGTLRRNLNRRLMVSKIEAIEERMRDVCFKAGRGKITAESMPLLESVSVLLDVILKNSGGEDN